MAHDERSGTSDRQLPERREADIPRVPGHS